jgi:hypothetical protein
MNWFKLVGATGDPAAEDWEHEEPDNFTEIRFPWNKPPTDVWSPGRIVLYAVERGVLMATQTIDGAPSINQRRGPTGSLTNRWPHTIKVKTHRYCSPLTSAPELRTVAPEFAEKYSKRFRQGSHWRITDDEYQQLAAAVERAGRPYRGESV